MPHRFPPAPAAVAGVARSGVAAARVAALGAVLTLAALSPARAADDFNDLVSRDSFTCGKRHLPVVTVARSAGRPWMVVIPWEGEMLTLRNKGTAEKPMFQEPDADYGYDWVPKGETVTFGLRDSEGSKRKVIMTCRQDSGEGGI